MHRLVVAKKKFCKYFSILLIMLIMVILSNVNENREIEVVVGHPRLEGRTIKPPNPVLIKNFHLLPEKYRKKLFESNDIVAHNVIINGERVKDYEHFYGVDENRIHGVVAVAIDAENFTCNVSAQLIVKRRVVSIDEIDSSYYMVSCGNTSAVIFLLDYSDSDSVR